MQAPLVLHHPAALSQAQRRRQAIDDCMERFEELLTRYRQLRAQNFPPPEVTALYDAMQLFEDECKDFLYALFTELRRTKGERLTGGGSTKDEIVNFLLAFSLQSILRKHEEQHISERQLWRRVEKDPAYELFMTASGEVKPDAPPLNDQSFDNVLKALLDLLDVQSQQKQGRPRSAAPPPPPPPLNPQAHIIPRQRRSSSSSSDQQQQQQQQQQDA